jgi:hypothetical protein
MNLSISSSAPLGVVAATSLVLSLVYLTAETQLGQTAYPLLNQIGPIITMGVCLWGAYRLASVSSLSLWTPALWLLFTSAIYYGFGPLVYPFGTPESVDFADKDFPVDEHSLLRSNLLNSVGIGIETLVLAIGAAVFPARVNPSAPREFDCNYTLMWMCLIVGGTVKYLFTLPFTLGLLPFILPGSIQHLAGLTNSAIILIILHIHRGNKHYWPLLLIVLCCEVVGGLMALSKTEVILTALAVILGRYLCRPTLWPLIRSILILGVFYVFVLSPFVSFARIAFGSFGVTNVEDLGESVETYGDNGKEALAMIQPGVQAWWTRFNYANVQAFTMESYDEGVPGKSLSALPFILVPRVLYHDKPLMMPGRELTFLIQGDNVITSTGLGFYGEAYWNGGWGMVLVVSVCLGVILMIFGRFAMTMIATRQFAYMPVIMIGIWMGLRPDEWSIMALGLTLEAVVWFGILSTVVSILKWRSIVRVSPKAGMLVRADMT